MYWLVRSELGNSIDKTKDFLENNYWQNISNDKKFIKYVNKIKEGDILLLADKSYIKHFGKCIKNPKNGKSISIDNWKSFKNPIYLENKDYNQTIIQLKNKKLQEKIEKEIKLIKTKDNFFISKLYTSNFMSLPKGSIKFARGINLLIGENGSGKSQILKLIYSIIEANNEIKQEDENLDYVKKRIVVKNLTDIFKAEKLGNLVNKGKKVSEVKLDLNKYEINFKFNSAHTKNLSEGDLKHNFIYKKSIFIPAKEVLSFYKGFRIIYENKYLEFDKTYYNLCRALENPLLKRKSEFDNMISELENILDGEIEIIDGRFYLISNGKKFEINLVAEGFRKIGMLAYLLKNDSLDEDSILIWDEPEANMHPKLIDDIINFLVMLANRGMQIFISTHSLYVIESLNNHLKRYKIGNLDIKDKEIGQVVPLDPNKTKAYLLENSKLVNILDNELGLIDDKLLENFNEINFLYEKMRDIEWNNMNIDFNMENTEWNGEIEIDSDKIGE
jgi:predicted ATP-dependent endonuclease of OLD family